MAKYVCDACGWEYDEALGSPENGIAPGTKFEVNPPALVRAELHARHEQPLHHLHESSAMRLAICLYLLAVSQQVCQPHLDFGDGQVHTGDGARFDGIPGVFVDEVGGTQRHL